MTVEFIPFGESYHGPNDVLVHTIARESINACFVSKDFEINELRRLSQGGTISDIIVVDCVNDQVPTHNRFGIKVRERLALVFAPDKLPEVRALRSDFPNLPHMNHVLPGEPVSLCLYSESWHSLQRTWTPQKHLQQILWWLTEAARGTLHREDQTLEPLYFESPFEIVLPPDFEEKLDNPDLVLLPMPIPIHTEQQTHNFRVIRGFFHDRETSKAAKTPNNKISRVPIVAPSSGRYEARGSLWIPQKSAHNYELLYYTLLPIKVPPIVHGIIEKYPQTLGELHDQIANRGGTFLDNLRTEIKKRGNNGLLQDASNRCLLVLSIQLKRSINTPPEKKSIQAFDVNIDLTGLGEKTGALTEGPDGGFYSLSLLGEDKKDDREEWREISICPITVKTAVTGNLARITSDVDMQTADFRGVLAGVGALGSAMAELWAKEHWGAWSFIDPDFVKPHNIIRHIAKDVHIGSFKVDVVKHMVEINYQGNYYHADSISKSANDFDAEDVKDAISKSDFLVDATTTIEVPRDISQRDDVPRSATVFLTPSGKASILLMESSDRSLRLDVLEAQYYRSIINADWGKDHLEGHKGNVRVGTGCRDVSAIISYETIQFHAAMLARQVRLLRDKPESYIRVWSANFETGALAAHEVSVYDCLRFKCGDWQVIMDTGLQESLSRTRMSHLPNETGGVILGYIDQKLRHIYVVDVLNAPPDSEADRTGFTRGVEGLKITLDEVARRTNNIVHYLGEWHSHPAFTSAYPSGADRALIKQLADALELDGQPALMIIVGSTGEVSVSVKEACSNDTH